ncbi:MAG: hypothetical protein ABSG04_01515 [Verrucomicrobiota bacterium]
MKSVKSVVKKGRIMTAKEWLAAAEAAKNLEDNLTRQVAETPPKAAN